MSTRRDFLALVVGAMAIAALPIAAEAHPLEIGMPVRDEMQIKLLLAFRELDEAEQTAFLNGMERQRAGMPMREAIRGVYVELGRPVPDDLI